MSNIQPFDYQKSTNIEEHNQIVNKVNEIVRVINDVNLDAINSEIADLKTKATATDTEIANIKDKDSMQDTEIDGIDKSLISDVTATFDNPSRELKISVGKKDSTSIDATVVIPSSSETGQYSAGNGISIENYQIAVDTNVVALKTDIPVVPDVSGINNRLDTIDGEITEINANITNLTNKNTEQDTAINGKVAIAQGTENAGKVLGIGSDGNVTPVTAGGGSGGELWERVNIDNWPTDWVNGDKIKVVPYIGYFETSATSWTTSISLNTPNPVFGERVGTSIEIEVSDTAKASMIITGGKLGSTVIDLWAIRVNPTPAYLNNTDKIILESFGAAFNGKSCNVIYSHSSKIGTAEGKTAIKEQFEGIYRIKSA